MPALDDYRTYGGGFPTTAAVAGALEWQGTVNPWTGKPYSEALLAGLAGGIAFGYFVFAYEGVDPQANIVTRNTFHDYGWDALSPRLGLVRDVVNATGEARGRDNLVATLEEGRAPIVWPDVFSLGYERSDLGDEMWMTMPVVVTAYEPQGEALLDDRASVPIRVDSEALDAARARVKKDRFRLVTVDLPEPADLAASVRESIGACLALFTGKPPRGSARNFGFTAYERWMDALRRPASKDGWGKTFSPGRPLFAGLSTAFRYALLFWEDGSMTADRALYADFLDEAAEILDERSLADASAAFRASGEAWRELGRLLLPDAVPTLAAARAALVERHQTFLKTGNANVGRLRATDAELERLAAETDDTLPDDALAARIMSDAADGVERVRDAERAAIYTLAATIQG